VVADESLIIPICKIYKNFMLQFTITVFIETFATIARRALRSYHFSFQPFSQVVVLSFKHLKFPNFIQLKLIRL